MKYKKCLPLLTLKFKFSKDVINQVTYLIKIFKIEYSQGKFFSTKHNLLLSTCLQKKIQI